MRRRNEGMKPWTEVAITVAVVALIVAALIGMYIIRAEAEGLLSGVTTEEAR